MSGCPLWLENGESCCKTVLIPGARNEHGLAAASTVLESGSRMWGVGDEVEEGTGPMLTLFGGVDQRDRDTGG